MCFLHVQSKQRTRKGSKLQINYKLASHTTAMSYLFRSTVVTLNTTPLSHRIMKSLCEKGQFPMLSPSLPAWKENQTFKNKITNKDTRTELPMNSTRKH